MKNHKTKIIGFIQDKKWAYRT